MGNRNITLSLPEEELRQARIMAVVAGPLYSEDLGDGQQYDGVRGAEPVRVTGSPVAASRGGCRAASVGSAIVPP
jgi:hypothetical protein